MNGMCVAPISGVGIQSPPNTLGLTEQEQQWFRVSETPELDVLAGEHVHSRGELKTSERNSHPGSSFPNNVIQQGTSIPAIVLPPSTLNPLSISNSDATFFDETSISLPNDDLSAFQTNLGDNHVFSEFFTTSDASL